MAGGKGGAGIGTLILVILHILVFASLLIMCAIVFNSWANGTVTTVAMFSDISAAAMLFFSFLAGAVGLATMIMAVIYGEACDGSARYASFSSSLNTYALVALAFGFACKVARNKPYSDSEACVRVCVGTLCTTRCATGSTGSQGNLMIAIVAFDIFLGFSMLLYLLAFDVFGEREEGTAGRGATASTSAVDANGGAADANGAGSVSKSVVGTDEERAVAA